MRLLGFGCAALFAAAIAVAAQSPQRPDDHPDVASAPDTRANAAELTERLRPSGALAAIDVPRRNLIDEHVFGRMSADGVPHAPLASDAEFFRRIHIDLTGRLPGDETLRAFLDSADPDKRDALIDDLLDSRQYESKWTYFFGDLYKNAFNRIGNEGKNVFAKWIADNIHLDRSYAVMVQEMLTATAVSNWYVGPAGYVARWVVIGACCDEEIHEDTADELAVNSVKHFLGVDMTCVSCHNGRNHLEKINTWLTARNRSELWGMSAFFGRTRVLRRTERSTAQDEYSIDDLGPGYDPSAESVIRVTRRGQPGLLDPVFFTGERPDPGKPLRQEYARMLTSHPQFARTTVNLLWSEMFGVGIVDPPLDFDLDRLDPANPPPEPWTLQPTHPELLEGLAQYLREHDHSLKSVLRLIAQSSAYQLSSTFPGEWRAAYAPYYARKFVRRLKAEEVYDSIVGATNLFTEIPIRGTDIRARFAHDVFAPDDFRGNEHKDLHFFLEAFGQTNREYSERSNEGEITQAVLLMNSPFVLGKIKAAEGSFLGVLLADEKLAEDERITRLYQRFLVRSPTTTEVSSARQVVHGNAATATAGWEDLQWLMMNKVEFVHNF
jgi:hypothetical protein